MGHYRFNRNFSFKTTEKGDFLLAAYFGRLQAFEQKIKLKESPIQLI